MELLLIYYIGFFYKFMYYCILQIDSIIMGLVTRKNEVKKESYYKIRMYHMGRSFTEIMRVQVSASDIQ